jgi:hypothetical protein
MEYFLECSSSITALVLVNFYESVQTGLSSEIPVPNAWRGVMPDGRSTCLC